MVNPALFGKHSSHRHVKKASNLAIVFSLYTRGNLPHLLQFPTKNTFDTWNLQLSFLVGNLWVKGNILLPIVSQVSSTSPQVGNFVQIRHFFGSLDGNPCVFISFLVNWGETPNISQVNSVKIMNILVGNLRETWGSLFNIIFYIIDRSWYAFLIGYVVHQILQALCFLVAFLGSLGQQDDARQLVNQESDRSFWKFVHKRNSRIAIYNF